MNEGERKGEEMEKKNCSCEAEKEERRVKRGKMEKKKKALVFANEEKLESSERSKGTKEEPRKYEAKEECYGSIMSKPVSVVLVLMR